MSRLLLLSFALVVALAACDRPDVEAPPPVAERPLAETRADSIALRGYDAVGGPEVWGGIRYLQFEFAAGRDTVRQLRARHQWDRQTGDYRMEMPVGPDSLYVVRFNVDTRAGEVWLNDQPVDTTQRAGLLERAYRRFINDTYWLLAPTKAFDPGVTRAYVADSSNSEVDVITLTFDGVGLTPGDRYWLYYDRENGRLIRWAYHLQGYAPDQPATVYEWVDYETYETPAGTVHLSNRKVRPGGALYTDRIAFPSTMTF